MSVLGNLEPKAVFKHFESISKIPRASFKEKAVSDFIFNWAKNLGLKAHQDDLYNLIIKKPGSAGYENSKPVIIQGHLDMVCEKNSETQFDFDTQGLDLYVNGDYIQAKGTTLGADNGVAVAYAMALLEDETLSHPPLEVALTTSEESGMDGAKNINESILESKLLINLDSEDEGVFLSSCAGGLKAKIFIDLEYAKSTGESYQVFVGGLRGGHSGMDIDKGRANANKLLARLLANLQTPYSISHIDGGAKDNAIPREAFANITIQPSDFGTLKAEIKANEATFINEYAEVESNLFINLEKIEPQELAFSKKTTQNIINILLALPNGVYGMSQSLEGLVESSNNVGVVKIVDGQVVITCAVRSSIDSRVFEIETIIKTLASIIGAKFEQTNFYPGWQYTAHSPLRESFKKTYKSLYNKEAEILAIHAGVECGIFAKKIEGLDMISLGPNMSDVHTPDEKLSISSTKNVWEFLLEALKNLK